MPWEHSPFSSFQIFRRLEWSSLTWSRIQIGCLGNGARATATNGCGGWLTSKSASFSLHTKEENEERDRRVSWRTCSYGLSKFCTVTSCFVIKFCSKTFHLSKVNTSDFQHLFGFSCPPIFFLYWKELSVYLEKTQLFSILLKKKIEEDDDLEQKNNFYYLCFSMKRLFKKNVWINRENWTASITGTFWKFCKIQYGRNMLKCFSFRKIIENFKNCRYNFRKWQHNSILNRIWLFQTTIGSTTKSFTSSITWLLIKKIVLLTYISKIAHLRIISYFNYISHVDF